jgi:hypothetical protein
LTINGSEEERVRTQQEIETSLGELWQVVAQLQNRDDERRKRWRGVRTGAGVLALLFALIGAGFFIFSIFYPTTHDQAFTIGIGLILQALPFTLIRIVLDADAASARPASR